MIKEDFEFWAKRLMRASVEETCGRRGFDKGEKDIRKGKDRIQDMGMKLGF